MRKVLRRGRGTSFHAAVFEEFMHTRVDRSLFCKKQHAARRPVEAVHDTRIRPVSKRRIFFPQPSDDRIVHIAALSRNRRLRKKAIGFIDDYQTIVFV